MNHYPARRVHLAGLSVLALVSLLAGCSSKPEETKAAPAAVSEPKVAAVPVRSVEPAPVSQNVENSQLYKDLHQTYSEAVTEKTPDNVRRPPDETVAGKKTAEIWRQIKGENGSGGLWEQIRFMTPRGQRISYLAVVKTSLGEFHIELLPDVAPNHVRNFIALARAGYYDGLGVDYILKQKEQVVMDGAQEIRIAAQTMLLAGCPLATGEEGQGSIGYWLKPEPTGKCSHEEGTIGSWPLENAACKFYINMAKAPWMDAGYTAFGRVGKGLDVVRKIAQAPQKKDDKGIETGDPLEPIVIQTITIVQKTEE